MFDIQHSFADGSPKNKRPLGHGDHVTETTAVGHDSRVFVDEQSPDAYRALSAATEAVKGVAAAGLDRTPSS
jgi:hypothetical protein